MANEEAIEELLRSFHDMAIDPYNASYIKKYDRMLHGALRDIYLKNFRNFARVELRAELRNILDQEVIVSSFFKDQFERLPILWIAVLGCYQKSAKLLVRTKIVNINEPFPLPETYYAHVELNPGTTILHAQLQMYPSWLSDSIVRHLVMEGADVHAQDNLRRAPLHYAMRSGRTSDLIKIFLDRRVNINVTDYRRETPLLLAIDNIRADDRVVPLLLRYGADVLAQDERGYNVLHRIAETTKRDPQRAADLARVLMDKGASLQDTTVTYRDTPLHLAIKMTDVNLELIQAFLERGADVNIANRSRLPPLHLAVGCNQAEKLVKLLLRYGANVSAKGAKRFNLLHQLAIAPREHVELANFLIGQGVSVFDTDEEYLCQPIHLAAFQGKYDLVKFFLDLGVDPNVTAAEGVFPLWLAAESNATDVLIILLQRGADYEKKTSNGRTALHKACLSHHADSIKLFLCIGANIFAEDNAGATPFAVMMEHSQGNLNTRLIMLKELALKKMMLSIDRLKDESIINNDPVLLENFQKCIAQLEEMRNTRRILLTVLTKSHRKLALLVRNADFVAEFRSVDLGPFPMYAKEITLAFERAQCHHLKMLEQEEVIDQAFYKTLPDVLTRKLIGYIFNDVVCC
ncbi:hypothetical protein TSAR_003434 [Trichomalopsis sarcophagae]|uniref:Uncharacterized protein n=1 Tax=Trichomalopsis sarcophagae TaxID=543379 RepID=A0A232EN86_9HYME|nr:hypothetical protein TSAR_003434 [Trichomalopsis sarcophagae]